VAKPEGLELPRLPQVEEKKGQHEFEMSTLPKHRMKRMHSGHSGSQASSSDDELDHDPNSYSERRYRDPDMVAMPYLSSNSKVAVPVGSNGDRRRTKQEHHESG